MNFSTKLNYSLIIIFLSITLNSFSQKVIGKIEIEKKFRNITNLSGNFNNSISFHLIINKNKEDKKFYKEIAFFDEVSKVKTIKLKKSAFKPNFIAYHINGNVITLLEETTTELIITDVNYATEEIFSDVIKAKPKYIFSHNNSTFLVIRKSPNFLDFIFVNSAKEIKRNAFEFKNGAPKKMLSKINSSKTDLVDDTRFIDKGFIKNIRAFYSKPQIIFVSDDKKKKQINIATIEPDKPTVTSQIQLETKGKIKKLNSFIKDGVLFVFYMEKKEAALHIYKLKSKELLKTYNYNVADFGKVNKVVVNGEDRTHFYKPKRFYKSYFPQAIGSTYNAELYVGVNKTKDNKYIVQVGHVDKNKFRNPNSGNYWWNYSAFNLNYNLSNGSFSGGFSPAGMGMLVFEAFASHKRKGNYFELYLDDKLEVTEDKEVTSQYEAFNSSKYITRLKKHYQLNKRYFVMPINDIVRLINYDSSTKNYQIYNFPKLKDD